MKRTETGKGVISKHQQVDGSRKCFRDHFKFYENEHVLRDTLLLVKIYRNAAY